MAEVLSSSFRTFEGRRSILRAGILRLPEVIRCWTILRREIWEMAFRSWILSGREFEGPACELQGCMISDVVNRSSEFELKASHSGFVGGIAKISSHVERFFHA
jgi:hypothetical protein